MGGGGLATVCPPNRGEIDANVLNTSEHHERLMCAGTAYTGSSCCRSQWPYRTHYALYPRDAVCHRKYQFIAFAMDQISFFNLKMHRNLFSVDALSVRWVNYYAETARRHACLLQ